MDNVLKQRILGIIVLFALIGICITVLLHNNKNAQQHSNNTSSVTTQQPVTTTIETPSTQSVFTHTQKAAPIIRETQPQPYGGALSSPAQSAQPAPSAMQQTVAAQQPQPLATPTSTQTTAPAIITKPIAKPKTAPLHATKSAPVAKTKPIAKPTEKTLGGAKGGWGVQVGTFSNRSNAESLVRTLHAKGFSATAQGVRTEKGEMTRVVVGTSDLSRERAEGLKTHLSKSLNLTGFVTLQDEKGTGSNATIAKHRAEPKKHPAIKREIRETTPVKQTVKVENINSVTIP